jgi:hypothetical protein
MRPTALGTQLSSSCYGSVIPVMFGRVCSSPYLIWAQNLRQGGGSGKKFKSMKKGPPTYVENADFLLGHNPILYPLQMWINGQVKLPLTFKSVTGVNTGADGGFCLVSDPAFYCVVGVEFVLGTEWWPGGVDGVSFDDYGGSPWVYNDGSTRTVWNVPGWNAALAGGNPTDARHLKTISGTWGGRPVYFNQPGSPIVYFQWGGELMGELGQSATIYYAALAASNSPLAQMRLAWEAQLGSQGEFASCGETAQQIKYKHYAGFGASSLDLGSAGTIPQMQVELLADCAMGATGDAEFADIIEHILHMGMQQASLAVDATEAVSELQNGLGLCDYPGCIQKNAYASDEGGAPLPFCLVNTAGNILVAAYFGSMTSDISDLAGNTWTAVPGGTAEQQVWTAISNGPANPPLSLSPIVWNQVRFSAGGVSGLASEHIYEIGGMDTLDLTAQATGTAPTVPSCAVESTVKLGEPGYLIAFIWSSGSQPRMADPNWKPLCGQALPPLNAYQGDMALTSYYRVVHAPGTYNVEFPVPTGYPAPSWRVVMLSFKNSQPVSYPRPLGDILDYDSLQQTRFQCTAFGLKGSLLMDSQRKASDWLAELYQAANAAPVWSGFRLKSIPMSEQSTAGNGAVYSSPTASGPVADITDADYVSDSSSPPVEVDRKPRIATPNIASFQHPNRDGDYAQVVTSQPDQASVALFGARKDSPQTMPCIYSVAVAEAILGVKVRRLNYLLNTYKFKLQARWKLLDPMDLITITDSKQGIAKLPVRLRSVEEDPKHNMICEAEDFIYGLSAPTGPGTVTPVSPYIPPLATTPASVNAPIIFEAVPALSQNQNEEQVWIVVSDSDPAYGGCVVFVSTDGGASYNQLGVIIGNATTGVLAADWPAAADPDSTNSLQVDLTESRGTLPSYQTADEDNFAYPCYVAGGTSAIPYELMCYALANLTTGGYGYTLVATGGSHLRRDVFGAPSATVWPPLPGTPEGVDHAIGARFAELTGAGIFKVTMDPGWVGKTLHFKFCAFNNMGGAPQSLSDDTVVDYTFTPTGLDGILVNPDGTPPTLYTVNGT